MNLNKNVLDPLKGKKNIIKLIKRKIHYNELSKLGIKINIYKNVDNNWLDIFNNLKADQEDIIDFLSSREAFGKYEYEKNRFSRDISTFPYTIVVTFPIKINKVVTELTASCILQKMYYPGIEIGHVWWLHEVAKFPVSAKPSLIPIMMNIAEEIIKQKTDKLYLLVKYPKKEEITEGEDSYLFDKKYQQKIRDFNWLSNRYKSVYNYNVLTIPNEQNKEKKYENIEIGENSYMVMYKKLRGKKKVRQNIGKTKKKIKKENSSKKTSKIKK